ncbi:SDR family oxidoreductase [Pigmentiphaga soli]|uniref:SDR family oxidoreductase n=1 Tax=Pigmentiphaga soli TaxID=1007095 RepID=A0ABP8GGE4_9BURK
MAQQSTPQSGEPVQDNALEGLAVLVTGGARGLGAAIGRELVAAGAQVLVADLNAERARQTAEQLGGKARGVAMDVGDEGQIRAAIDCAVESFGRLDAVINNAAIDVTLSMEELAVADWERVLRTNLTGPFLVTKLALPRLRASGRGHVVNIASTASKRAWPNASAYHATKWGLLGLSHALHAELRPHGIKVSAVVAGGMRTPFLLDRFPDIDAGTLQDPANVARAVRFVLTQPAETVIPEVMVLPMRETSWP